MSGNTFGKIFKITTFGESHGVGLGVIIDGTPSNIKIDEEKIQKALDRRRPGQSSKSGDNAAVTSRKEGDKLEILSGIFEGYSTGTPISINIRNTSQHSSDYGNLATSYRPGHADYTFDAKYGIRDYRGGGRSSGRETCARVAAGSVAQQVLEAKLGPGFSIKAYTLEAAGISCKSIDYSVIEENALRAPDLEAAALMEEKITEIRRAGDSAGAIIECVIDGVPAGLGEPVFDKIDAELGKAMLSIGAVKGIEFGEGFNSARMTGSVWNDKMRVSEDGKITFETNHAGGILGGISNGNQIVFRLAVKPVPSIFIAQKTVNKAGENIDLEIKGRHDVCLAPRIVPVVEAMAAITILDLLLQQEIVMRGRNPFFR